MQVREDRLTDLPRVPTGGQWPADLCIPGGDIPLSPLTMPAAGESQTMRCACVRMFCIHVCLLLYPTPLLTPHPCWGHPRGRGQSHSIQESQPKAPGGCSVMWIPRTAIQEGPLSWVLYSKPLLLWPRALQLLCSPSSRLPRPGAPGRSNKGRADT